MSIVPTFSAWMLASATFISFFMACVADPGWTPARATWFDVGPDLSKANCHFSWVPTGRNVGAWSDHQDGFASSCGKCYEVKCRNADFPDGYGNQLHRSNACYDESKTVVITIADACPCRYPNNAYSNQRWCCGDMNHLDISQEVFQQLADLNIGVIGLSYREVDCASSGSSGGGNSAPAGVSDTSNDKGASQNTQNAPSTTTGSSGNAGSSQQQGWQWSWGKWGGKW